MTYNGQARTYNIGDAGYEAAKKAMNADGISFDSFTQAQKANRPTVGYEEQPYVNVDDILGQYELEDPTAEMNAVIAEWYSTRDEYIALLEDACDKGEAAKVKALEAALQQLDAQKPEIMKQQEEANRKAYIAYMQGINPYGSNQASSAMMGLGNSGYAESNMVSFVNTYRETLNNNEQAKNEAINVLEQKKIELSYQGETELAGWLADWQVKLADANRSFADQLLEMRMQAIEAGNNYALQLVNVALQVASINAGIAGDNANRKQSAAEFNAQQAYNYDVLAQQNAQYRQNLMLEQQRYAQEAAQAQKEYNWGRFTDLISTGAFSTGSNAFAGWGDVDRGTTNALAAFYYNQAHADSKKKSTSSKSNSSNSSSDSGWNGKYGYDDPDDDPNKAAYNKAGRVGTTLGNISLAFAGNPTRLTWYDE